VELSKDDPVSLQGDFLIPWEVSSPGFIPRKSQLRYYPKKERVDHGKM
jgi:hypothetical protein